MALRTDASWMVVLHFFFLFGFFARASDVSGDAVTPIKPLPRRHLGNHLLDKLVDDQFRFRNLTGSPDKIRTFLSNDSLTTLLSHLGKGSGLGGNWSGLGSLLNANRTARTGDFYGASSYGGWGGGGEYGGGGGYGGNDNGLLWALLLGRGHDDRDQPQQQQDNSNNDLAALAFATLLGLALIGNMPTQ